MLLPISYLFIPIRLAAWVLIGGWFLLQLVDGITSLSPKAGSAAIGGVAYWAHIGGFFAGAGLIRRFRRLQQATQPQSRHSRVDRWRDA